MRDRIYINFNHRSFLKYMDEQNILGFHLVNKKDIFLLAVALGLKEPKDIAGKKDGYFLLKDVKSSDRAYFASILLGKKDRDVDKCSNDEINYDESERCAEAGFNILKKKIDDTNGNEELLLKRLLSDLDLLYEANIK